jgi:hypothetical protein
MAAACACIAAAGISALSLLPVMRKNPPLPLSLHSGQWMVPCVPLL